MAVIGHQNLSGLKVCSLGTSLVRLEGGHPPGSRVASSGCAQSGQKKRSQESGFLVLAREPINEVLTLRTRVPTYKCSREDRETVCSTNLHPHSIDLEHFQYLVALVLRGD